MSASISSWKEIHSFIEQEQYKDASSSFNHLNDHELPSILEAFEEKSGLKSNCIQLILKKEMTTDSINLLEKLITKINALKLVSKLQEPDFFKEILIDEKTKNIDSLLEKHITILSKNQISNYLISIIDNNITSKCDMLVKNLKDENIESITNELKIDNLSISPLMQAIRKKRITIFKILIKKIHQITSHELLVLPLLNENEKNILHIIAEESAESFLEILWNQSQPHSFSEEIVSFLDKQDPEGQTSLFISAKEKNESLVKEFLYLGADPNISSKEIKPKDLETTDTIKKFLIEAEYGLVPPSQKLNIPNSLNIKMKERKEKGLIRACSEGKLEIARKLIKEKVNPKLLDDKQNSLPMILLNLDKSSINITSDDIIDFIEFIKANDIDFRQMNQDEDTLLTLAILKDRKVALHLIEKYSDKFLISHSNKNKQTALTLAASLGYVDILEALFNKYKNDIHLNQIKIGVGQEKQGLAIIFSLMNALETSQKKNADLGKKLEEIALKIDKIDQKNKGLVTDFQEHLKELSANIKKLKNENEEITKKIESRPNSNPNLMQNFSKNIEFLEKALKLNVEPSGAKGKEEIEDEIEGFEEKHKSLELKIKEPINSMLEKSSTEKNQMQNPSNSELKNHPIGRSKQLIEENPNQQQTQFEWTSIQQEKVMEFFKIENKAESISKKIEENIKKLENEIKKSTTEIEKIENANPPNDPLKPQNKKEIEILKTAISRFEQNIKKEQKKLESESVEKENEKTKKQNEAPVKNQQEEEADTIKEALPQISNMQTLQNYLKIFTHFPLIEVLKTLHFLNKKNLQKIRR